MQFIVIYSKRKAWWHERKAEKKISGVNYLRNGEMIKSRLKELR